MARKSRQPSPQVEMSNVEGGQDAPTPVDLRVILVDFRDDQEYEAEENGETKATDEGIRLEVKVQEGSTAQEYANEPERQLYKLVKVWVDCFRPVDTVRKRLQDREHHDATQVLDVVLDVVFLVREEGSMRRLCFIKAKLGSQIPLRQQASELCRYRHDFTYKTAWAVVWNVRVMSGSPHVKRRLHGP